MEVLAKPMFTVLTETGAVALLMSERLASPASPPKVSVVWVLTLSVPAPAVRVRVEFCRALVVPRMMLPPLMVVVPRNVFDWSSVTFVVPAFTKFRRPKPFDKMLLKVESRVGLIVSVDVEPITSLRIVVALVLLTTLTSDWL